jgi:hypothetical protein
MTYNEPRPNPPRHTEPRTDANSTMMWLGGLLVLALIVGGIFWATSTGDNSMVADRPTATTGAGQTTPAPAPAPAPAPTNR